MKLRFIKVSDVDIKAKATIHKTGKLGFSSNAIDYLQIDENKFIKFAFDDEDKKEDIMYAVITDADDSESFNISKAGNYFYVNTKGLFDNLGFDYTNNKIIYDLVKFDYEGHQIIKMIRRIISNKKKEVRI
jgi:hypothetical protein